MRDRLVRVGSNADVVEVVDELCRRYHLPTSDACGFEELRDPAVLARAAELEAGGALVLADRTWYRRHRGPDGSFGGSVKAK